MSAEDVRPFRKCLSHRPRETGQGFLWRQTAFFGAPSSKAFCSDFNLDLVGIQHGEPDALLAMAAKTKADADELIRCTPRRISNAFMSLNGQVLHTRTNPRSTIRMCPLCARDDIAANPGMPLDQAVHLRCEWTIGVIDACHVHGVKLITYTAEYRTTEKLEVGYEAKNILEQLKRIEPEPARLDDFHHHVLGRIGSVEAKPSPLLDHLPLVTVTQLCHATGLDLLKRRGSKDLNETSRRAAGFEMLGHGQDGLDRAIVEMRHGMNPSEMATRIMPRLLEYLHESILVDRSVGDFPDVLAQTLFRLLPYVPGQVVLGRTCDRASMYHFREAKRVYGVQSSWLHAFIAGTPKLAIKAGPGKDNYLIHREVADSLFLGRTPFVTGMEVVRHMGRVRSYASRVMAELTDAGIVKKLEGAIRPDLPPLYSLPEIDKATMQFVARFEAVDPEAEGMVEIEAITSAYGVKSMDLWRHLTSGRIRRMGMVLGQGFLKGMRLDLAEVLSVVAGIERPMKAKEVSAYLGTREGNVRNLAANGFLASPRKDQLPAGLTHVFDRDQIEDFHRTYVSKTALKKDLVSGFEFGVLIGRGLEPAIDLDLEKENGRTIFYRRSEIEKLRT